MQPLSFVPLIAGPWWSDPWFWVMAFLAALAGVLFAALLVPKSRRALSARFVTALSQSYQRQIAREFQRKYPGIYARFSGFKFTPESQAALMAAMKRIPPQEAMKLQAEFMRLTEGFQNRHPELNEFLDAMKAQDGKAQGKAMQKVFKLPEPQRRAIEKDLLWAYDQLSGRFPKWVKLLEGTLRGPAEPAKEAKAPEPAGKK